MFALRDDMKVLLVSHRFPPEGTAGVETYTADLGAALVRSGHEVHAFAAAKDIGRPDLSTREREHRGIAVHELINNLFHDDFRQTWDHPRIDRIFEEALARLAPDVVHFQHLLYLSAGCVEAARRSRLPVLFTLHDYWLQCPRFGQLVHADGGLCETIDFARCGTCLPSFKFAQSPTQRRVGSAIAGVRSATGIDLAPLARSAARGAQKGAERTWTAPAPEDAAAMALAAEERARAMRERVVPCVDLFIAPSRFLRERFLREWQVPGEKIELMRFGGNLEGFSALPRTHSTELRVAFVGSLIAVKGPHLLLEAWGRITPELRAQGSLVLHGPAQHEPDYVARLELKAREVGARLAGRLERREMPGALASIDLLVVPSLWFENAPLVIFEAFAAGTPLLVSDLGGMAELIEEGRGGWRFRAGDADDLARRLSALLADRSPFDSLDRAAAGAPNFDEHVAQVEARYRALT